MHSFYMEFDDYDISEMDSAPENNANGDLNNTGPANILENGNQLHNDEKLKSPNPPQSAPSSIVSSTSSSATTSTVGSPYNPKTTLRQHQIDAKVDVIDLERQIYFWKKCCEEKDKEIVNMKSELHFVQKKLQTANAALQKAQANVLSTHKKKRKVTSEEYSMDRDDCKSTNIHKDVKKLKVESMISKIKMDMMKQILCLDENIENYIDKPKPEKQAKDKLKLKSYKKEISKLESANQKYKVRVDELEKSLKEVLVHVLEQGGDSQKSVTPQYIMNDGQVDEIESIVDEIESPSNPGTPTITAINVQP